MTTTDNYRYEHARDSLMLEHVTDLAGMLENLSDKQRIAAVLILCDTISEEGTIEAIREITNNESLDDA